MLTRHGMQHAPIPVHTCHVPDAQGDAFTYGNASKPSLFQRQFRSDTCFRITHAGQRIQAVTVFIQEPQDGVAHPEIVAQAIHGQLRQCRQLVAISQARGHGTRTRSEVTARSQCRQLGPLLICFDVQNFVHIGTTQAKHVFHSRVCRDTRQFRTQPFKDGARGFSPQIPQTHHEVSPCGGVFHH